MAEALVGEAWIEIHLEDGKLPAEVEAAVKKAARRAKVIVEAEVNERGFQRTIDSAMRDSERRFTRGGHESGDAFGEAFVRDAQGRLRDSRGRFVAEGRIAGEGWSEGAKDGIKQSRTGLRKEAAKSGEDGGNFFTRAFARAASKDIGTAIFRAASLAVGGLVTAMSPLASVVGGGVAALVALTSALVTASGAAISLAGVLGSLGLAGATLKVGMAGVADALSAQSKANKELAETGKVSASTQEALAAAMKNLAPAAAATVVAIQSQARAWGELRRSVQESLFAGVSRQITRLSDAFLPVLRRQLTLTASEINKTAVSLSKFLTSNEGQDTIGNIFESLRSILKTLLPIITPIVRGFLLLFEASLPFAQDLADAIASIGKNFGTWAAGLVASGKFRTFLQDAFVAAGHLIDVLGGLGSILASVFRAGTAAGTGLLDVISQALEGVADFLKSAEGQSALASFFGLISAAGSILVNTLGTLQPLLDGVRILFDSLQGPVRALGVALAPVIAQLAVTLGGALASLAPLLARLVVALTPVIAALAGGLVAALDALFKALLPILPSIVTLVETLLTGMLPVLANMVPVLLVLVDAFGIWVESLIPLMPTLIELAVSATQLSLALSQMLVALAPLLILFAELSANLLTALTPAIRAAAAAMRDMLTFTAGFVTFLAQLIQAVVDFAPQFLGAFAALVGPVRQIIFNIVSYFISGFLEANAKVLSNLRLLVSGILGILTSLASAARSSSRAVVDAIVEAFEDLVGQVSDIFGRLGGIAVDAAAAVLGAFLGIPGRIVGLFSGLGSRIRSAIGNISLPKIPGLPGFAKGGITNGPAIAGEGPYRELVVPIAPTAPLNPGVESALAAVAAARGVGGSGEGTTVNMTVQLPTGDPGAAALAVLDRLVPTLEG